MTQKGDDLGVGGGRQAGWEVLLSWTCSFDRRCMKGMQMAVSGRQLDLCESRQSSGAVWARDRNVGVVGMWKFGCVGEGRRTGDCKGAVFGCSVHLVVERSPPARVAARK